MPTLNIEGVGRVKVDDAFLSQSPDMQQAIVKDIVSQVKAKGVATDMASKSKPSVNDQAMSDPAMADVILQATGGIDPRAAEEMAGIAKTSASNVPQSAANFASNVVQPIIHPVETAQNLGNIGKGVLQKLGLMSGKDAEPYANAVGKFLYERYGSLNAVRKTIENDPVGLAADLSMFLSGGAAAAARAPGAVGEAARAVGTIGRAIDPLTAAGKAATGIGKVASEGLGITTGAGTEAIRTAAQAGAEGGQAGKAFLDNLTGRVPMEQVVQEAKQAVSQMKIERGNEYRAAMKEVGADKTVLDFSKIDAAVNKVASVKTYKGQNLSPATQGIRQQITEAINEWKALDPKEFHTPEGIDALKQKIGDVRDAAAYGSPERVVADAAYNAIRQTIVDQVPEYARIMKGYEEASGLIKEMENTLSLNPKASVDTQLRKLQSALRNNVNTNYGRRAELIGFLERSGATNLMEKLSGQALSSAAPRGLGRILAGSEGIGAASAFAAGNPALAASLVGGLAASSPMIAGGAAFGAGALTRLPLRGIGGSAFQAGRLPTN